MGMAASQARLIELTARKSNVEYEGQQINQQRINLSNESAGMFNQLMGLTVPTPPSTSDYTKTVYTFSDGTTTYTIDSVTQESGGSAEYNATVRYYSNVTKYTGMYKEKNDLDISKKVSGSDVVYYYGTTKLADYNSVTDDTALTQIAKDQPDTAVAKNYLATDNITTGTNPDGTTWKKIASADTSTPDYYTKETYYSNGNIKSIYTYHDDNNFTQIDYDATTGEASYSGTKNGVALTDPTADDMLTAVSPNYTERDKIKSYTSGGQTYYVSLDQFDESTGKTTQPVVSCYATDYTSKEYKTSLAYLQQEESGRYSSITLEGYSNSMDLTATQETDQNAYNDAMNEYTYQQALYEKQVQDINAKTEQIQIEDRTLEMKLKQLDTEQDALQTEMDAVKKVIDKNVESTFKTFS